MFFCLFFYSTPKLQSIEALHPLPIFPCLGVDRLTQNLAWVITSGTPLSTPNTTSIGSGGWPPRSGEMLMVCAFYFVCSSAQLGVKLLDRFWRVMSQNACFWKYCIPLGVRITISQFQGVKIFKNRQKLARIGIFQPKCQNLTMAISPKQ